MADIESQLDFLTSKPLLGYQLDASHLHTVLQNVFRQMQQQSQSINGLVGRVGNVESHVEQLNSRVSSIENALGSFGGADELRVLRQTVGEMAKAVDQTNNTTLPELRRGVEQLSRQGDQQNQALQQLAGALPQLEKQNNAVRGEVDNVSRAVQGAQDQQRTLAGQVQQLNNEHAERERDFQQQRQRGEEQVRDIANRADRLERDLAGKFGQQLEDLSRRNNDNFAQIEMSHRAVDAELNKLRTDVANVRAEVNTIDNDTRFKLGKVTDDVDSKFNMLLNAMQNIERSSTVIDQVLTEAGRAMAANRANMSSNPATPFPNQTTTTTTLGDQGLQGRVQRSFSNELERQPSANRGGNLRML